MRTDSHIWHDSWLQNTSRRRSEFWSLKQKESFEALASAPCRRPTSTARIVSPLAGREADMAEKLASMAQ